MENKYEEGREKRENRDVLVEIVDDVTSVLEVVI